jgi:hypothetical protein
VVHSLHFGCKVRIILCCQHLWHHLHPLSYCDSLLLKTLNFIGVVCKQPNSFHSEILQNQCCLIICSRISQVSKLKVGIHSVVTLVLQVVGSGEEGRSVNGHYYFCEEGGNKGDSNLSLSRSPMPLPSCLR